MYRELVERHGSIREAARQSGIPYTTFHKNLKQEEQDPAMASIMAGANTGLVPRNAWVRTEDADGNKVTVHLQPEQVSSEDMVEALKAGLSDVLKVGAVPSPDAVNSDLCTYYNIADLHMGLLCWGDEVGENWDSEKTAERLYQAMSDLIDSAPPSERAVILDLGDLSHANDNTAQTPKGKHSLDVDTRFFKVIRLLVFLFKELIKLALKKHKEVVVRNIPGNHNPTAHIAVMMSLAEAFEDEPRVTVEVNPSEFFVDEWGINMVAAHHGDKAKPQQLILFAADEWSEIWGRTKHRFFWTGHVHHSGSKDIGGMKWESFRTIIPRDAYAYSGAYTSRQQMCAITLHKSEGERLRNMVNF